MLQTCYTNVTKSILIKRRIVMKSTGIVRKVDELGRIVLPKELRTTLGIAQRDPLEIYIDGENIILRKYEPACIFCGSASDVTTFMDKKVCAECAAKISK